MEQTNRTTIQFDKSAKVFNPEDIAGKLATNRISLLKVRPCILLIQLPILNIQSEPYPLHKCHSVSWRMLQKRVRAYYFVLDPSGEILKEIRCVGVHGSLHKMYSATKSPDPISHALSQRL